MRPLPQGAPRRGAVRGADLRTPAHRVSASATSGWWRSGRGSRRRLWKPADDETCARFHRVRLDVARCAARTSGRRRTGSRQARPAGGGAAAVVRGAGCGSRRMMEHAPASTGCASTWRGVWGGRPGVGARGLGKLDQRRARLPGLDLLDHRVSTGTTTGSRPARPPGGTRKGPATQLRSGPFLKRGVTWWRP